MNPIYDVIVVGAGPAGLTAALYTARAKLNTLIIEKETIGGELMNRDLIENYPGYPDGILGPELGSSMMSQALNYGTEIRLAQVESVGWTRNTGIVNTTEQDFECRSLILANGAHPRRLNVPGELEFAKNGVFYCATCDGPGFAGKTVVVAGGGDSGLTEALLLARYVSRVIVVEVMPRLTATAVLQDRVRAEPKIETRCGTKIEAVIGNGQVNALELSDVKTGDRTRLQTDGLLVHVGLEANTGYLRSCVPLDDRAQVVVNENMATAIPGVFAAGDMRHHSPMQISTAVGDGATAGISTCRFLGTR